MSFLFDLTQKHEPTRPDLQAWEAPLCRGLRGRFYLRGNPALKSPKRQWWCLMAPRVLFDGWQHYSVLCNWRATTGCVWSACCFKGKNKRTLSSFDSEMTLNKQGNLQCIAAVFLLQRHKTHSISIKVFHRACAAWGCGFGQTIAEQQQAFRALQKAEMTDKTAGVRTSK